MTAQGSSPRKSLQHKRAAHAMHAKYGTAATRKARGAFLERFEREVDPEGNLSAKERELRAAHARKAYMAKLGERSAEIRKAKRSALRDEPRQESS